MTDRPGGDAIIDNLSDPVHYCAGGVFIRGR